MAFSECMGRRNNQIGAVLAFFTCFCLGSPLVLTQPLWGDSASILLLPVFGGVWLLYERTILDRSTGQRRLLLCLLSGLLMAALLIAGGAYASDEPAAASLAGLIAALAFAALLSGSFLLLLLRLLDGGRKARGVDVPSRFPLFVPLWILTGLVWFPTFLAVFPGIYSYDASVQVLQFFGDMPVTSHHPLLHTLFLCGSLKLGDILFHSYQAGMAIHSVLQAGIMGGIFTYVIVRMIRGRRPAVLILAAWLFLIVNPYIQILVFTTTKDVLFGGAFLLAFLFSIDFAVDPERFLASRGEMLRLYLSLFFCCLLRNQGIYVFVLYSLFSVFCLLLRGGKGHGRPRLSFHPLRRLLGSAAALLLLYLTLTGPVFAALGVEKGDPREMLSVPMQQLARVFHEAPENLSAEERDYLLRLIPQEYLDSYVRVNADPVKSGFQTAVVREDPAKFVKTWLSVGLKAPKTYVDSFCMGNWGYWYPGESQYWIQYILFDGAFMEEPYNVLGIRRNSRLPGYESFLREISLTPAFEDIPVLAVILNQAFPFWLMLVLSLLFLERRRYRLLLPLTLLFGYWGTLLLGPVTSVRYAFPLMICVPVLLDLGFSYIDGKG